MRASASQCQLRIDSCRLPKNRGNACFQVYCRRFLTTKAPEAAVRAGQIIERQFLLLESSPDIGRPDQELPELREFVIPFGNSGYVALYRFEPADYAVYVLAFRQQK